MADGLLHVGIVDREGRDNVCTSCGSTDMLVYFVRQRSYIDEYLVRREVICTCIQDVPEKLH